MTVIEARAVFLLGAYPRRTALSSSQSAEPRWAGAGAWDRWSSPAEGREQRVSSSQTIRDQTPLPAAQS